MKDLELSNRGKALHAGLCVACCGFPMLIVFGIVSIGAAFTIGVSLASAVGVAGVAYLVVRHRTGYVPQILSRAFAVSGAVLAAAGFWLWQSISVAALSASIALLATSALLVVADMSVES